MTKSLFLLLLSISFAFGATLKVGDTLTQLQLPDQFGKQHTITAAQCTTIVIANNKDASVMTNNFLNTKTPTFLQEHRTCYISDIHSMPSLITKLFALPKMKKYTFPILLMYEAEENIFPKKDDFLTVVKFTNNKITSIDFENNVTQIFR